MSRVRLLVGTRKGAFILEADGQRRRWKVSGPLFAGWEIYHMKASPVAPERIYASQTSGWFGQVVQRSDDGGLSWQAVGNQFLYEGEPGTHLGLDGRPYPWVFRRVWHLEPDPRNPDTVYAGVEDAALFRSRDAGRSWEEVPGLRTHASSAHWHPGAGGLCLHTILLDPDEPAHLLVAISAAGVFGTTDGGAHWQTLNRGLRSDYLPNPEAEVGHCVHRIARHPARPHVIFMQKHWDVMRSDDGGQSWQEISGDLPSDFGFALAVHPHEPNTLFVIPIKSDTEHYPPEGKLRVYRSRSGGHHWEPLAKGLPQRHCYVNVLRGALTVDALEPCGVYFGTTGGQLYASADGGERWRAVLDHLPPILSVEAQTLP